MPLIRVDARFTLDELINPDLDTILIENVWNQLKILDIPCNECYEISLIFVAMDIYFFKLYFHDESNTINWQRYIRSNLKILEHERLDK